MVLGVQKTKPEAQVPSEVTENQEVMALWPEES